MLPLTASLVFSLKSNPSPSQFNLICNIKEKLKGGVKSVSAIYKGLSILSPKIFI